MAIRKRAKSSVTLKTISNVAKVHEFVSSHTNESKTLHWIDSEGNPQEIALYSENYPAPPAHLKNVVVQPMANTYWFNHYPEHMMSLIRDTRASFQKMILSNTISTTRSRIRSRVLAISVFLTWLDDGKHGPFSNYKQITGNKTHPEFPRAINEITRDTLLLFRSYLYENHAPDRLEEGKNNGKTWENGIVSIIKHLCKEESNAQLVHPSVTPASIANFSRGGHVTTTEPYSTLEMYMILKAADDDCTTIEHNWNTMREIEKVPLLDHGISIENICWYVTNIIYNANTEEHKDLIDRSFWTYISSTITKTEFYSQYSSEEIITLSKQGTYPYALPPKIYVFDRLNETGQRLLSRLTLRSIFRSIINLRNVVLSGSLTDWKSELVSKARKDINIQTSNRKKLLKKIWIMAGLIDHHFPYNSDDANINSTLKYISLFFPDRYMLYPFHLFVHATSGLNRETINTLDRQIYPDATPETIAYRGTKNKTGSIPRKEELSTPTADSEPNGISHRIEFVKSINEHLLPYASHDNLKHQSIWIAIESQRSWDIAPITDNTALRDLSNQFCRRHDLVEFIYDHEGNETDFMPMEVICAFRIRKSGIFNYHEEGATYHELLSSLNDKSFDSLFKYYLNSDIQRRQNIKAIAAIQRTLIDEMTSFSRENKFQGVIVNSNNDSYTENIITNKCGNKYDSNAPGQESGTTCKADFRHCLGCKQSRVFKEHLPVIAFTIIQYNEAKSILSPEDWESSLSTFHDRASDCLEKYSEISSEFEFHVKEAWIIAKTPNSIFVPPLMI